MFGDDVKIKAKKRLVLFIISFALITIILNVMQEEKFNSRTGWYYPILPESEEWKNYNAIELVKLLQIPEKILKKTPTEELLEVVLDYPYLTDIYYFGNQQEGFKNIYDSFNGIRELFIRKDIEDCLNKAKKELISKTSEEELGFSTKDRLQILIEYYEIFVKLSNIYSE